MTTPPLSEARERLEVFLREDVDPALADGKSLLVRDLPTLAADLRALLAHIDAHGS